MERLHLENDKKTEVSLTRVIFIWSKLNQDLSYKQGMHEICYMCWKVAIDEKLEDEDKEADCYSLFFQIMKSCKNWYDASSSTRQQEQEILKVCKKMLNQYIKKVNFQLYQQLVKHDISLHLFCMRWIRLLFIREFKDDEEVLVVWDFLCENGFDAVEWIAVAMISIIRDSLLAAEDSNDLLKILMKPFFLSATAVLKEAEKLKHNFHSPPTPMQHNNTLESLLTSAFTESRKLETRLDSDGLKILQSIQNKVMASLAKIKEAPSLPTLTLRRAESSSLHSLVEVVQEKLGLSG